MTRRIIMALLALGVVVGIGAGCSHLGDHHAAHRAEFQSRVAEICVEAALKVVEKQGSLQRGGETTSLSPGDEGK